MGLAPMAAGDDNSDSAWWPRLGREGHSLQSRAANFVDGHGRDARRASTFQRRLPSGILPESRLHDITHDRFIDLLGFETSTPNRFSDNFCAELGSGESCETALKFSDGRTNRGENNGGFHASLLQSAKDKYSAVRGRLPKRGVAQGQPAGRQVMALQVFEEKAAELACGRQARAPRYNTMRLVCARGVGLLFVGAGAVEARNRDPEQAEIHRELRTMVDVMV